MRKLVILLFVVMTPLTVWADGFSLTGALKSFNDSLKYQPKKVTIKVDGLIAENLHTKCDKDSKKVCWEDWEEAVNAKGRASRFGCYTAVDKDGSESHNNRLALYYDSPNKTEVYIFFAYDCQGLTLLDDYVTSQVKFVATGDRF